MFDLRPRCFSVTYSQPKSIPPKLRIEISFVVRAHRDTRRLTKLYHHNNHCKRLHIKVETITPPDSTRRTSPNQSKDPPSVYLHRANHINISTSPSTPQHRSIINSLLLHRIIANNQLQYLRRGAHLRGDSIRRSGRTQPKKIKSSRTEKAATCWLPRDAKQ